MTLLSIARPRSAYESERRNEYNEFLNRYSSEGSKYARNCQKFPAVNIIEQAKTYLVQMAVPGYSKADFSVNIEKDLLVVSTNIDVEKEENYIVNEFSKCSFERSFSLGKSIDTSKVDASYRDGILTITLSKREEAIEKPPRTISVS
ncbi:MAG: Hsp20/alpha crystallin family protein [Bacteroidales bacterium]|jgi:HSP20 family protein|nr:Hsp20/alpha crystallin family protein [Bacteroidales bacterium]MDD4672760.1 Hsp20/alpha crystallin family protein [Bacteroidales bacterium]MDY0347778.1 Hsp20/alpha crystallin family protein [Tenuifilaceae bacterium]